MIKKMMLKFIYSLYYLFILIVRRWRNDEINNSKLSERFIRFNNKLVLKRLKNKQIDLNRVAILLPHCIQNYDCPFKITSDINNCKGCGKCKVGDILDLHLNYGVNVKVATGGTLARMFLKETRPKLVIAVACERDLVSGIYDAFPLNIYGVFNKRVNGPCFNTDITVEEILNVIKILKIS